MYLLFSSTTDIHFSSDTTILVQYNHDPNKTLQHIKYPTTNTILNLPSGLYHTYSLTGSDRTSLTYDHIKTPHHYWQSFTYPSHLAVFMLIPLMHIFYYICIYCSTSGSRPCVTTTYYYNSSPSTHHSTII